MRSLLQIGHTDPENASKETEMKPLNNVSVFVLAIVFSLVSSASAQPPNENDKPVQILLSSIVTTSPQAGMFHYKDLLNQQTTERIRMSIDGYSSQIFESNKGGASNVFLVDAGDAATAIAATYSVLVGPWSANTAAYENKPDPSRGLHWMVAYLSWGDDDVTTWEVDEVCREGNSITLKYHRNPLPEDSDQEHQYYFWVQLGKLVPGSYEVKLEDGDSNTTTLMRRVKVSQ
jgi:hypothetical protein